MRPYLAILRDSFREALASRSLLILLAVITLFLIAIAPLGYRESITVGLDSGAVREWPEFIDRLRAEGPAEEPSPSRRIWELLEPDIRERVEKFSMPEEGDMTGAFEMVKSLKVIPKGLDTVLRRTDFYVKEDFEDVRMFSEEARELKTQYCATH